MKHTKTAAYGSDSPLTLSVMTLRNATLAERVRAAQSAGFQGIGWRLEDFEAEAEGVRLLMKSSIKPDEVEFFREWVGCEDDPAYLEKEARLLALAGRIGARRINVAVFKPKPREAIVRSLSVLCRRAAEHKLIVQLEFMPYTPPVTSLRHAWEIVHQVNEPNAGLLIDSWQWARAGESVESLRGIPPQRITGIQLSDDLARPLPDIVEESRHDRKLPGEGALDLPNFLKMLADYGVNAPLSVEVMSDDLDALPPTEAAQKVASATRSMLSKMTS